MPARIANILAGELARAGFLPDELLVKLVGSRIACRGEEEFERLRGSGGAMNACREICSHHLGIGASFTEFLVSPVSLSRDVRSEVAALGGIAHTIYAVFDALLDVSGAAPALFGEHPQFSVESGTLAKQKLVVELVDLYFHKLDALAAETLCLASLLRRGIQRLYDAELRSSLPDQLTWSTWWRKNALPIVIMGLPGWLSARDESKMTFSEHLRWLARVGEFLGWLDDFSDYERDREAGHANRLKLDGSTATELCARQVAEKGKRVLSIWDSRSGISPARDTFTVIVWMWLAPAQS